MSESVENANFSGLEKPCVFSVHITDLTDFLRNHGALPGHRIQSSGQVHALSCTQRSAIQAHPKASAQNFILCAGKNDTAQARPLLLRRRKEGNNRVQHFFNAFSLKRRAGEHRKGFSLQRKGCKPCPDFVFRNLFPVHVPLHDFLIQIGERFKHILRVCEQGRMR